MKKYLAYEEIKSICNKINEHHLPVDDTFIDIADEFLDDNENEAPVIIRSAFKELLKNVDTEIKLIENNVNIAPTCFKGCDFCCYFPIITTKLEAKLMLHYIESLPEKESNEIMDHLMSYLETYATEIDHVCSIDFHDDHDFKKEYISKQLPCPFLDKHTRTCKAYEIRPIPCRTYLNYADPNVCANSYMPKETFSYEFLQGTYFSALNTLIQEFIYSGEDTGINFDYPNDLFEYDYLPKHIESLLTY